MKTLFAIAVTFLVSALPAMSQYFSNFPAAGALSNSVGVLTHKTGIGYHQSTVADFAAHAATRIASSNYVSGAQLGTSNFVPTVTAFTTNYPFGQLIVNGSSRDLLVIAPVRVTAAAVSGSAGIQLRVQGSNTNTFAVGTTASSLAVEYYGILSGIIPAGATFCFTNSSTGAGNASALFKSIVKPL